MVDCSGAKALFEPRSMIRALFISGGLLATGVAAWTSIQKDVEAADKRITSVEGKVKENKEDIGEIKQDIGAIKAQQGIIINQIDNERRRSEEYRNEVRGAFERVFRKLDERK